MFRYEAASSQKAFRRSRAQKAQAYHDVGWPAVTGRMTVPRDADPARTSICRMARYAAQGMILSRGNESDISEEGHPYMQEEERLDELLATSSRTASGRGSRHHRLD